MVFAVLKDTPAMIVLHFLQWIVLLATQQLSALLKVYNMFRCATHLRRNIKRCLRQVHNEWWVNKAKQMQDLADKNNQKAFL